MFQDDQSVSSRGFFGHKRRPSAFDLQHKFSFLLTRQSWSLFRVRRYAQVYLILFTEYSSELDFELKDDVIWENQSITYFVFCSEIRFDRCSGYDEFLQMID